MVLNKSKNNMDLLKSLTSAQKETFFELLHLLQQRTETHCLLSAFYEFASAHIVFTGLRYLHEEVDIELSPSADPVQLSIAMMCDDRCLGILEWRRSLFFEDHEIDFIEKAVSLLSSSVRNAFLCQEYRSMAMTDPMTGAGNRRAYDERIEEIDRLHHSPALLMIDIDHFKVINDTYGHSCGDRVIRKTAQIIRRYCRSKDRIYRCGGEEFAVVLQDVPAELALEIAERMRMAIMNTPMSCGGKAFHISISVGASIRADDELVRDWVDRTDHALYQAKRGGRNQTRLDDVPAVSEEWICGA